MTTNSTNWNDALQHAELSDVGMRRTNNQDSYSVALASNMEDWNNWGHLFLVADGMGAHAAGELASKLASDAIPHLYRKHAELSPPEALKRAVEEANAEINRKGQANEEFHNMGTTCSVLTILPQGAVAAHVGDSRVYRLRKGKLEQLTFDHSLVWEMKEAGQLSSDSDVSAMVPRNVITRSLGPYADVRVDLEGPFPTEVGDTFLLCSDGLVGEVSDDELGPIIAHLPPAEAARALVDLTNLRGGSDNVTVVIAQVTSHAISSAGTNAEPLTINNKQNKSRSSNVNPILGVIAGACLLASLLMLLTGSNIVAAGLGIAAVILALILALRVFGNTPQGTVVAGGRRFGKAPYTSTECVAVKGLVQKLRGILDDLRAVGVEQNLSIDWKTFQSLVDQADQAQQSGDHSKALRMMTRAMSFSMEQLRTQRG